MSQFRSHCPPLFTNWTNDPICHFFFIKKDRNHPQSIFFWFTTSWNSQKILSTIFLKFIIVINRIIISQKLTKGTTYKLAPYYPYLTTWALLLLCINVTTCTLVKKNFLAFLFHLPLVAGMEMNLIQEMENVKHVLYTKFKKVLSFGNFIRHDSIITYIYYTDKNNIHFALVLRQFFCFTGVSRLLGERPTLRCSRSKLGI